MDFECGIDCLTVWTFFKLLINHLKFWWSKVQTWECGQRSDEDGRGRVVHLGPFHYCKVSEKQTLKRPQPCRHYQAPWTRSTWATYGATCVSWEKEVANKLYTLSKSDMEFPWLTTKCGDESLKTNLTWTGFLKREMWQCIGSLEGGGLNVFVGKNVDLENFMSAHRTCKANTLPIHEQ